MIALKIVKESVNGDHYYDFICQDLLPKLQPFNGINSHSVVIADNASIHHVDQIPTVLDDAGQIPFESNGTGVLMLKH